MPSPLTEQDREQILADLTEAHNVLSNVLSDLRSRYSGKVRAVKVAAKAERNLFQLKQEIRKMELGDTGKQPLPAVTRGGKVVDLQEL